MTRWLAILALLVAVPAEAQVFKPGKSGGSSSSSSSSAKKSSTSAKKSSAKKSSGKKSSKKSSAKKAPDDAPKVDPDYVKIIDDDDE